MLATGSNIAAVVLAGDHRWSRATFDRLFPRPLLPVVQSPLICYALRWLRDAGVLGVTLCANSTSRQMRQCLGDGSTFGLDLAYFEDKTPRGAAGCVHDALLDRPAETVIVADSTVIPRLDLRRLLAQHAESSAAATVVVGDEPLARCDDEPHAVPMGVYVFERRALAHVADAGYQDIKELLIPRLNASGERVELFESDAACPRVTSIETYLAANAWMLDVLLDAPGELSNYRVVGEALVHPDAVISSSARLFGPQAIGPAVEIGPNTLIVGPTVIGAHSVVQRGAVVARSVIWEHCCVKADSFVDRSILSYHASVAARAVLYNTVEVADISDGSAPSSSQGG